MADLSDKLAHMKHVSDQITAEVAASDTRII